MWTIKGRWQNEAKRQHAMKPCTDSTRGLGRQMEESVTQLQPLHPGCVPWQTAHKGDGSSSSTKTSPCTQPSGQRNFHRMQALLAGVLFRGQTATTECSWYFIKRIRTGSRHVKTTSYNLSLPSEGRLSGTLHKRIQQTQTPA